MHAYLVTQRGAATLAKHAVPIDHQADGLMLTLSELGMLRLFALPQSVAAQCLDGEDKQGAWHTHVTSSIQQGVTTETATTTTVLTGGGGQRPCSINGKTLLAMVMLAVVVGFLIGIMAQGRRYQRANG